MTYINSNLSPKEILKLYGDQIPSALFEWLDNYTDAIIENEELWDVIHNYKALKSETPDEFDSALQTMIDEHDNEIADLQNQIDELNDENNKLSEKLSEANDTIDELEQQIETFMDNAGIS